MAFSVQLVTKHIPVFNEGHKIFFFSLRRLGSACTILSVNVGLKVEIVQDVLRFTCSVSSLRMFTLTQTIMRIIFWFNESLTMLTSTNNMLQVKKRKMTHARCISSAYFELYKAGFLLLVSASVSSTSY